MATVTPRTLSGFMELLPAPQQQMERMMEILRTTYSRYGFTPLDTPAIEASEVLLAKGGGETEKQIYRFQKGDADLSLRFDLTVPLAKYVALHYNDLAFPFRRYQIGKVYRGERAQRGRFREFYQADIDIIGDGKLDITNEAEIPSIIYQTFTSLGLTRFQIRVNNRKILNGFYAMLGLTEQSGDIMRTVDKLDKIGADKVRTCLTEDVGLTAEQADEIMRFISITGSNRQVLDALAGYQGRHKLFDQGLEELNTVTRYLSAFGVPEENFAVDLTIARGLDYYTGTVYETTLLDHPEIGSVCSGGRYDKKLKVNKNCNVVVVGGGTAGLEAACTAAEVGCNVFLLEKSGKLGGLSTFISDLPSKNRMKDFPKYLEARAKRLKNLYVFLNCEATVDKIKQFKPDIIVNATGSVPVVPPIKGLKENIAAGHVDTIFEMIQKVKAGEYPDDFCKGKKVVVVGGGSVGLDVVEYFAPRGAECTIVDMLPQIGMLADPITKCSMRETHDK